MPFLRPSRSTIMHNIESGISSRIFSNAPILARSIVFALARSVAGALHSLYGSLVFLQHALIETTAQGQWLDLLAQRRLLTRRSNTLAEGTVIFTGTNGTVIPIGTQVSRTDGFTFSTINEATIASGTASVTARADTGGLAGNTTGSSTLSVISVVSGLDGTATVASVGILGGVDIEDDESLRARVLLDIQSPAMGGSEDDYKRWALSVPGVRKVFVFANEDYEGLGTVGVVILSGDPTNPLAPDSLIASVQDYVDARKPVLAAVNVETVTARNIQLSFAIYPFTPSIVVAVTDALLAYFEANGAPRMNIILNHLASALIGAGVLDYQITGISLDGTPQTVENLQLTEMDFPVFQEVTLVELT